MKISYFAGIAFAGFCMFSATTAMAENKIAVMKIDSLDGAKTDAQAALIFEALRNEVIKANMSLESSGSDITYSEMLMVTGCEREGNIECYNSALETLGVSQVLFGSVDKNGEAQAVWYIGGTGVHARATGVVTDRESAEKLARDLIVGKMGYLVVTSNVAGADVFIDGKRVGLSAESESEATPIELVADTSYIVSIRKSGFTREDPIKVAIKADEKSKIHFDLSVATDPEVIQKAFVVAGWTTLGIGIASLITAGTLEVMQSRWQDHMDKDITEKYCDANLIGGKSCKAQNDRGQTTYKAKIAMYSIGGFFAAAGAALVSVGYLYDFTGEKADAELMSNKYMPKVDFQIGSEYQGMTMGWSF